MRHFGRIRAFSGHLTRSEFTEIGPTMASRAARMNSRIEWEEKEIYGPDEGLDVQLLLQRIHGE